MELKEYQQKALGITKNFLENLRKEKDSGNFRHSSQDAWTATLEKENYLSRRNGLGEDLPNFCLKIPTGGGKTLLAVKTIDLINDAYLHKRTGLVLWVVPTTQIYNQTIRSLRDKGHPYRQQLDIASGGRTLILEKTDQFSPADIEENLVVLMLMLPSANRQSKETLKVFKDSGKFTDFFPLEDDIKAQEDLLERVANLDTYEDEVGFWGKQIKTSLGNVLKLLKPILIVDEGHKAYSEGAQNTLHNFNPSIMVELSATPSEKSNLLVEIYGRELNDEEMIKLDLHITNKVSADWKDTMLASINHLNLLQKEASDYIANGGSYIRPICLIQVERTGKDQRESKFIHAEDVREYLINVAGVSPEEVAIKSSEKDELKEIDDIGGLMSPDCHVRFIITKQALQEGWDCSFAYVLTVLTNPSSKNALTQLVGRILRQPFARKTKIPMLDESYVFCFQQKGQKLLESIRQGFKGEGLGDLEGKIVADTTIEDTAIGGKKVISVRESFEKAIQNTILPVFLTKRSGEWSEVSHEMDIIEAIDWTKVDLKKIYDLPLSKLEEKDEEHIAGLAQDVKTLLEQHEVIKHRDGGLKIDVEFMSRHLMEVVPNPWIAYEIAGKVIDRLIAVNGEKVVKNNFVFIIEELVKQLTTERDRLSEAIFKEKLGSENIKFLVIKDGGFKLPAKIAVEESEKRLNKVNEEPLQRSLFDYIPASELNEDEKSVAWYLDDQEKLFFWYRNRPRYDYAVQGWRKNKIRPDFIFATKQGEKSVGKVYVMETKGIHLKNEDTDYKKAIFDICNQQAKQKTMTDLGLELENQDIEYRVVYTDEWRRQLNSVFA